MILILSGILLVMIGIAIPLTSCNHVWAEPTCMAPQTCEVCGKTKGEPVEHSYTAATCTLPPICRYCITPSGEPLGHDWQPATCIKGESCKRCSVSRCEKAPHTLGESTDGKTKNCTVCGESIEIQYVALTFDDGPSGETTLRLLDGLKQRNAKATFFLCGYRIKQYPDHPALIAQDGHEIGLHTESHAHLTKVSTDQVRKEIRNELNRLPGDIPIRLLRPPGGYYDSTTQSICRDYGLSIIMWSLDTLDWNNDEPEPIIQAIKGATAGDIILMHDIKENSVDAALEAIDYMTAKGYVFVTVSELSEIMDCPLYGGSIYESM